MLTQDHEKQTASRSSGVVARVAAVAVATFLFAVAARTTLSNQPDLFTTSPQPEARGMGQVRFLQSSIYTRVIDEGLVEIF